MGHVARAVPNALVASDGGVRLRRRAGLPGRSPDSRPAALLADRRASPLRLCRACLPGRDPAARTAPVAHDAARNGVPRVVLRSKAPAVQRQGPAAEGLPWRGLAI